MTQLGKPLEKYLQLTTGTVVTSAALAKKLGVARATWYARLHRRGRPEAEDVVVLARRYGQNPVSALVYCGIIDFAELASALTEDQTGRFAALARDLSTLGD